MKRTWSLVTLLLFVLHSSLVLVESTSSSASFILNMVEGHSVHRVATFHRQRLVGKVFQASSPNGRFTEGAKAISGQVFYKIEAVGKNLFAFFGGAGDKQRDDDDDDDDSDAVVVHVHFGMAGVWAVYQGEEQVPEPTKTNRLRLYHATDKITADLSAMTVNFGGIELYNNKRAKLGQDPLRPDADPELLWTKVHASKKSIGALIMDQSYFTGPGNIYRAEILFKAGVHPDVPGKELQRNEFDRVWKHTVELLQRGYETGSILTVDPAEAKLLGMPRLRRYIYNSSNCPRCQTRILTWTIASRTCYACPTCQPRSRTAAAVGGVSAVTPEKEDCVPFNSHCAREPAAMRLAASGPSRLTVKEIKAELADLGVTKVPSGVKKAILVTLLEEKRGVAVTPEAKGVMLSSEEAAAEKAAVNESLAVEHIAELAPAQARRARKARVLKPESATSESSNFATPTKKRRK